MLLPTTTPLQVVAEGLETPWALAFPSDGRILLTERPGRIRVVADGVLQARPWATLEVAELSEAGLLGIALAPDYPSSRHVYVFGVFLRDRTLRQPRRGLYAQVIRFTDRGLSGADPVVVIDRLPTGQLHAGGAIGFGPDGMLYVSIGDAFDQESAQDPDALTGAILRYRPDGSIPHDNPRAGSPVWAKGLRNVQAFAWHPVTGELFAIDHGPTGLEQEGRRTDDDELNVIRAGGNYGWPIVTGVAGDARFIDPIVVWTPALAPAGLAIMEGGAADRGSVRVWVTGLRGRQLRVLGIGQRSDSAHGAVEEEVLLEGELGRLRAIGVSPDGTVYIGTSNRDGRGAPVEADDRLLRIVPGQDGTDPGS